MKPYQKQFIELAMQSSALRFGEFTLKSGRVSPYFFNAGLFNTGKALAALGEAYAAAIVDSGIEFDMLFGPAYKGIPLAAVTAAALAEKYDRDVPYAFNRKEAKDHGEGGTMVGAPIAGKVLIIDDVITAGTAIREILPAIESAGGTPAAVVIGLDRQEVGPAGVSAVAHIKDELGIETASIIQLESLMNYFKDQAQDDATLAALEAYKAQYGA